MISYPKSSSIFQDELKRFLLFIRKCELNKSDMPNSLGETKPQWWPNDVIFEDDILLKTSNRGVSKINS